MKILLATRSRHKIGEIRAILNDPAYEFVSVADMPALEGIEPDEVAGSCEGNAIIKVLEYGIRANMLTIAEDTGLEVDALNGEPGVRAARYAAGSDVDRYKKLLKALEGVPSAERTARFRTVAAIYDPKGHKIYIGQGICEGLIAESPSGADGFGYDPVFFNPEIGKTNAELLPEEKNTISHRALAMKEVDRILQEHFSI